MSIDQLTEYAKSGQLVLHLDDAAFDKLVSACDGYIDALRDLKQDAAALSRYPLGLAEDKLASGRALSEAFHNKAEGGTASASGTFQSHKDQVEAMKTLFVALRSAYRSVEQNNAANLQGHGR
ncbi:hypothetical protein P3F83_09290 [Mycobacteroides immunogenum]|uniref:hypothetical protein n=1 Tax=Mycobacteroides immunogenum TaxID=83262 RepID=UPI0025B775CE|nr:hypothetical protein [Mycobacteroides immunogenum]WJR35529.1 hypothetical protein P3F83_09290 [Mycobacteroides immunogenum]